MAAGRSPSTPLIALVAAGAIAGSLAATPSPAGAAGSRPAYRVIVHLVDDGAAPTRLEPASGPADDKRVTEVGRHLARGIDELGRTIPEDAFRVDRTFRLQPAFAAVVTDAGRAALERHPLVRRVEPDRTHRLLTQEGLGIIGADVLHHLGIAGEGTAVAIIDSGVDYLHPTLGGGQIPNAKVVYGLDTADSDDDPFDCNGHGTAVASVAAGSSYQWSPGRRFAGGVAPAAKILAYKVTPDEGCLAASTSAVVAAIEDAVLHRDGDDYRLAAINISLGAGGFSGPCDNDNLAYSQAVAAATAAGVPVVAAAGNAGLPDGLDVPACLGGSIAVGSIWDDDPGLVGYSFCLDPDCTTVCDDSHRWKTAVACYSNSGPHLDVLAPSEYLKAAAAGAVTADFGGTSGAAAYVAGAVALLSQAVPGISPTEVSFLLRATGRPSMDDKNGLVRPIVDLAAAVGAESLVAVARDAGLPIGPDGGTPRVSTIAVDESGSIGSLRVLVDVEHPEPDRLRLALEGPDGTSVALVEPDAGGDASDSELVGAFPDELDPVESLGRFAGGETAGQWSLSVTDERATAEPGDARLMGWALVIEPPDAPPDDPSMVFPVVAHTGGVADTAWRSDVRLFNPSSTHDAEVRLFLVEGAVEDGGPARHTDVVVPHGSTVPLDDIVLRRFALDPGRGALIVDDPAGCVAHGSSRTYTVGDDGSYGQFVPPVAGGQTSTGAGEPALVVLPTAGDDQRVNLGFTEIGGGAVTVAVTVVDAATGVAVGPSTFHPIEANANVQLNGVLPDPDRPDLVDATFVVTVVQGDGRVVAYASAVDNRTGDAVLVVGGRPMITSALTVPAVARTDGVAGTHWRSDLRLLNHGSFSVHVDAELRLHGGSGSPDAVEGIELRPGESIRLDDVVGDFFGIDDGVGSLRLVPQEGPAALCASSRTANHDAAGSYGQHVPALPAGAGIADVGTVLHIGSSEVSRSNLGIIETVGGSLELSIRLLDHRGRALGVPIRTALGPFESIQINDIFAATEAAATDNARVEITRIDGAGRFYAYGSVIDARSGDAIFVPVLDNDSCPAGN